MSAIGDRPASDAGTERGFTLIEALVVVAIAALVAGIAFPRVERSLAALRFRTSLTEVDAVLKAARAAAISRRQEARVRIDGAARSIAIEGQPARILQDGTRFVGDAAVIAFYGDGSSSGGHVALADASGRQMTMIVTADTGAIGSLK